MTNEEINTLLAFKAADLLAEWAGLPRGLKVKLGADAGLAAVMMLASGVVKDANVDSTQHAKIAAYVKAILDERESDGASIYLDTDYGPGHRLRELGTACGIHGGAWPNKSMLCVNKVYGDGSGSNSVSVSTGYHGRTTNHYLTDDGWIIAGVNVDKQLHGIVRAACERGDLPADVATWVPLTR